MKIEIEWSPVVRLRVTTNAMELLVASKQLEHFADQADDEGAVMLTLGPNVLAFAADQTKGVCGDPFIGGRFRCGRELGHGGAHTGGGRRWTHEAAAQCASESPVRGERCLRELGHPDAHVADGLRWQDG